MSKEVEVTGLEMQATVSEGLEISLGKIGDPSTAEKAITVSTPGKTDISWKRAIAISEHYCAVGKLKPASTDDALDVFKVDETKIYGGGHAVTEGATITAATKGDSATMTLQKYGGSGFVTIANDTEKPNDSNSAKYTADDEKNAAGYYIDIPMWIRSANSTDGGTTIYADVTIKDPNTDNGSDLVKAVRVAFIPIASATKESDECAVAYASALDAYLNDNTTTANAITPLTVSGSASTATIFGLEAKSSSAVMDTATETSWPTYHGKVINNDGSYNTSSTLGTTTVKKAIGQDDEGEAVNVFTIPAATKDDYGRIGFVARIWLEGESIYCEDATANQDWEIDMHFSTTSDATVTKLSARSSSSSDGD